MKFSVFIVILIVVLSLVESKNEINYDFKDKIKMIQNAVKNKTSDLHGSSYKRLALLVDNYGPRLWGSPSLELFLMDLHSMSQDLNISSKLEPVTNFSRWIRGKEELYLLSPRPFPSKLSLIGLGNTPSCHVVAEAIVVNDWKDLDSKKDLVKGKIVIYNVEW